MSAYKNKKALKKSPKLKIESYASLIDRAFAERIDITENGRKARTTVFSAIYKKLLHLEITTGDKSACRARLAYDKFARKKQPEKDPEMMFVHEGKVYRGPQR